MKLTPPLLFALSVVIPIVAVGGSAIHARDYLRFAEPEQLEGLRQCHGVGTGYFLLPPTQTCMRLSGYLRASMTIGDNVYARQLGDIQRDSYSWYMRGQYRFSTATQTELGDLRTYMDLRSQWQDGGDRATASLRNGWIELAGWQIGLADTNFTRWLGNYGSVANDDILNKVSRRTNFISYTYRGEGGFAAMLALEQGGNGGDSGRGSGSNVALTASANPYGNFHGFRRNPNASGLYGGSGSSAALVDYVTLSTKIDDYMPNFIGGVKFKPKWGDIAAVAAYDTYYQEWAAKLRVNITLSNQLSLFVMGGYKTHQDAYRLDSSFGTNGYLARSAVAGDGVYGIYRAHATAYGDWGGNWIFWTGGQYRFNEKRSSFNLQLVYDAAESFAVSTSIMHNIVPGLTLLAEFDYVKWDDGVGYDIAYDSNGAPSSGVRSSLRGEHAFGGLLSLQRNF